jgi:predicted Zn-dependent protease
MPAVATVSERVSQDQQTGQEQTIRVLSYFIEYGDRVYVFHGVSSPEGFNTHLRNFEATFTSFNRLTDPSKLNKQPKRIRLQKVKQTGTLSTALSSMGVAKDQMEELALLNNMELTDQVQAGKTLKVIGE